MANAQVANVEASSSREQGQRTTPFTSAISGLLVAQFLGSFNDNFFKIVLSMFAVNAAGDAGGGALSLIGAIFIFPFLLFSGYAGHVADVYSKRSVLIATKLLEIVTMCVGFVAFLSGQLSFLLVVLFLLALQATFFSPAKYSILPELVETKDLSRANGLLEMCNFLAIILGTSLGSILFATWKNRLSLIGLVTIVLAVAGAFASLYIPKVPPSGSHKTLQLNPFSEIASGLRRLRPDHTLWMTVIGISYFWFLGALFQMDIILFGKEVMNLDDLHVGLLGTFLAIGIGSGSVAAGRLSGEKVELGLAPLGSLGMGLFSLLLAHSSASYPLVAVALVLLGFSGGLFIVPLNALLQQKSGQEEKGRLLATNNFLNTVGILLASAVLWLFRDQLLIQADRIVLIFGFLTLFTTVYILRTLPEFLIRFCLWLFTHTVYKIRIVGHAHVPARGPALLICNHMSFVDGLLVSACIQRFIRFLVYKPIYEHKALNWFMRLMKAIPVAGGNPKAVFESIERAREELRQGHIVCIFAEGAITRTGNLLPFKRGFERIVKDLDVPVIPVHLDRLWGSIFSFKDGKFFWKWPRRIPYPVTVSFAHPLPANTKAEAVRQVISELGSEAVEHGRTRRDLLHLRFIRTAKKSWFRFCMTDSTGRTLTYGKTLIASLLLARWLRRQRPDEHMIGLLLPASVAGALANLAVSLAGKIPVNLNFTAGRQAMTVALEQCKMGTILTSRTFLKKAQLEELHGMVYVEDILPSISSLQKLWVGLLAFLTPSFLLQVLYRQKDQTPDSLATIVFSSGSTGAPKGVMLSHHNVLSNVEAIRQVFTTTKQDCLMGVLPFFHSFGFTGTLWLPLIAGWRVAYHPNPLDAKTIGEIVGKHKATILISTPTFYTAYLRKCSAEEFASLRYAIAGAEKLRPALAQAFKEKYGVDLLEGYGCTEMAPVISVNIPDVDVTEPRQIGFKAGTVGHPLPGVVAKVIDQESGQSLPYGQEGLLLVKGPNRMLGYLGQPEKTAEVLREGWYVTGDIASLDDDGFIHITDRLTRFSKIGGEMAPHLRIEEAIGQILGEAQCLVTGVPDEHKGERLVVLHTHKSMTAEALWNHLHQTDLPRLWIPKREHFYFVESVPMLGTGKVDLRAAKIVAMTMVGMEVERVG
ncbi:MAG: MFS transporter [Deltaproteobacteria bacterium]|nr:MFS transporter [Deltaproteobacteria bacterium]